jgi:C4-dicarboxylate-specific signal transduction histidine kinase
MRQVLLNLIGDTVEAMGNRPTRALSVASVKEGATGVLVTVRDSGIVLGWVASGVRATFPVPIPATSGLVS